MAPWWFCGVLFLRNFSQLLCVPILIWWLKKTFFVKPSFFAKATTAVSDIYIFLPMYILSFYTIDKSILNTLMLLISVFEFKIFITYVPRLYQIATDKHDTFT